MTRQGIPWHFEILVQIDDLAADWGRLFVADQKTEVRIADAGIMATDIDVSQNLISVRASRGAQRDIASMPCFDEPDPVRGLDDDVNLRVTFIPRP